MGCIVKLSSEVRDKIAAGEVITRPVSVIKELIENSLDARAKKIDVEIKDGGKQKCLVNDDGLGMDRDDALLAIERYATSKIKSIDDIDNIKTLGFRGEALASIAQVSLFELETSDGLKGSRILVEAGETKQVLDSHRARGTRVKVSNIFFNLPARLKFLKSGEWERRMIVDLVKTYALAFPKIQFYLADSGREILNILAVDSAKERLQVLLSKNIIESLINVEVDVGKIKFVGFFSRLDSDAKHKFNYIYVNSRPVRYPRIYRTIIESYGQPKNLPIFLLNILVEPTFVDVNIHPTKNEVKFADERYVLDLLMETIKKQVFSKSIRVDYQSTYAHDQRGSFIKGDFVQDTMIPYTDKPTRFDTARESGEFWQLHDTYILAQTKSGLVIIDQHVAHERIIFEAMMRGRGQSQRLLFPITLELTPEEYEVYENTKNILQELGVEFKEFSSKTIVIDGLPTGARANREEIEGLFDEINGLGNLMKEKGEVAKVVACRSAIKAGQKLSWIEMQELIDQLFACENPYTCPHGRPVVIKFTLEELGRRFGRD